LIDWAGWQPPGIRDSHGTLLLSLSRIQVASRAQALSQGATLLTVLRQRRSGDDEGKKTRDHCERQFGWHLAGDLGVPTMVTPCSDAWRPPIPIDGDQGGVRAPLSEVGHLSVVT
jgi:hypothetical protein